MALIIAKTVDAKDPQAKLDYEFDWSDWLSDSSSDTISSATVSVPSGIVKESESFTTTTVTVWLSGGTAGEHYDVTCTINTAGGRTNERTMRVPVDHR